LASPAYPAWIPDPWRSPTRWCWKWRYWADDPSPSPPDPIPAGWEILELNEHLNGKINELNGGISTAVLLCLTTRGYPKN